MIEKVKETLDFIRGKGIDNPTVGIILGTGLGKLVNDLDVEVSLDYNDIPNFPEATVEFHHGKLLYGSLEGKKVLVMSGRFHSQKRDYSQEPPMARAKRHYIPGQIWHITHRCHKREFLLKFSKDRRRWLQWLYEAKKRYGLVILNYAVTSNHIHLLVVGGNERDVFLIPLN